MKIDSILFLSKFFAKRALLSLAKTLNEYFVGKFCNLLENILNKELDYEKVYDFISNNDILNGIPFDKLIFSKFSNNIKTLGPEIEYYVIQKNNEEPNDMKVNKSVLLIGNDQIPNLFYFEGKRIDAFNEPSEIVNKFPKELSNYLFIVNAFFAFKKKQEMYRKTNKEIEIAYNEQGRDFKNIEESIDFIKKYKTKIDKILDTAQYLPKYLGAGVDSIAYDIGKNMVLKLFKNPSLYKETLQYLNQLHESPELSKTEMMIYDAGEIGDGMYYSISEKMIPAKKLSTEIKDVLHFINKQIASHLQNNKEDWKSWVKIFDNKKLPKENYVKTINEIKQYSEHLANDVLLTITNDGSIYKSYKSFTQFESSKLKNNWLKSYVEEIIFKLVTRRGDLHSGNLGLTNAGEFRFYDSSHKDWTSKLNMAGWEYGTAPNSILNDQVETVKHKK